MGMAALVLTLVLALVWALFIAFGYWHGGWREVVALAGILLSYAVLSEWAGPNGRDLSDAFGWNLARTVTVVALAYLIGGAAILGYLGSVLFPRPYPISSRERLLGALVGVLNGSLMLAFVLRVLRVYTFAPGKGKALHDSALARFLIEDIGYVLIVAFVAGIGAVVAGFVPSLRRTADEVAPSPEGAIEPVPVAAPAHPVILPVPAATAPLAASPAATDPYAAAPVIDWPAMPPPGMPVAAPVAVAVAATVSLQQSAPARAPAPALAPPTGPRVPTRVAPPMWYPVETLMGSDAKERRTTTDTEPAGTPSPAESQEVSPSAIVATVAAALSALPPSPPVSPIPTMPPPGAPVVQSPPPPIPEAEQQAPEAPVIVRELDLVTRDSTPVAVPASDASEAETLDDPSPPRSDEGAASAGSTSETVSQSAETPAPVSEPSASAEQGTTPDAAAQEREPAAAAPPSREEASVAATAAFPTVTPPPLPVMPLPAVGQPEASRPRGSYARVAQTRQPAGSPPAPAPQPSQQPEQEQPLRPPVPTGPDTRTCPTCGYPVRPHTRYCPNCGSRLSR